MPQSLSQILIHLVFSTKDRFPFLDPTIREPVHAYLAEILRGMGSRYVVVGGVADHVHLLYDLGRTMKVSECVEELKRESSKYVKGLGANREKFYWQRGYGAFSVSPTERSTVVTYIHRQEEHHRIYSFQEEYRELLLRYEIEFDERYVWE